LKAMNNEIHIPVLLNEVLEYLALSAGDTFIDATLGFGGHSQEVLKRIGTKGKLIGIEQDQAVIEMAAQKLNGENVILVNENFEKLDEILNSLKIKKVDKILFDLGVSSFHFDSSGRGFSFQKDEPLDMRLSQKTSISASDLVGGLSAKELADLIYTLGDESMSRQIANAIVEARRKKRIETTGELTAVIESVVPRRAKINPSTKTFQALRIAVNDELNILQKTLPIAVDHLNKNGRIAVISFHSGEDRIVKNIFKRLKQDQKIEILTKKPLVATEDEIRENPRSRSAKLRVAQAI